MKKLMKTFITAALSFVLIFTMVTPALAEEQLVITENNIQELDQFVKIEDNQFLLEIPDYVIINEVLKNELMEMNTEINTLIIEGNFVINPTTKIAEPAFQTMAYGVNKISLSWNSIIIKMDAGLVRTVAKAAAAGGVAGALAAFPALVAFIAANPIAGVVIGAVVASVVDSILDLGINNGVEIHYNFFLFRVTVAKRQ